MRSLGDWLFGLGIVSTMLVIASTMLGLHTPFWVDATMVSFTFACAIGVGIIDHKLDKMDGL